MRAALILTAFLTGTAIADDARYQLKVITQRGLPAIEKVTAYRTKGGKRESVGELTKLDKPLELRDAGPFEVWVQPKGGLAVKAADKLTLKAGEPSELKLGDALGVVQVFGDNFPRAEKVVLTDPRDPGPGAKGHVAIQSAKDYRVEMLVPAGSYAVWVVPANGAKAQRVEDNVRVQVGRTVRVGG
jgi:hypothetical protein